MGFHVCVQRNTMHSTSDEVILVILKQGYSGYSVSFMNDAVHSSGAESGIFRENWVNPMAADALAPCVARTSAAMALTMHDKEPFVFYDEYFFLSSCAISVLGNNRQCEYVYLFSKVNSRQQGLISWTNCVQECCCLVPGRNYAI